MLNKIAQITLPPIDGVPMQDLDADNGLFERIVNFLLGFVALISVIMIIIGGIRYIISNGDQNAVTGAKNTILYAIVGLVIAIFGWAIVNFVLDSILDDEAGIITGVMGLF